jgi:hypothetical protein
MVNNYIKQKVALLTPEQNQWLENNSKAFSKYVRNKINEDMKEEKVE